jgi:histidyl-tRNA synthetase
MLSNKVERIRGANDVLPEEYQITRHIADEIARCFKSFGYRPIDVPVIEYTELYLRKAGEDVISRLYDFTYHHRRLSLRPEMTASVIRAYVDSLQGSPLPVRLYHAGPVFRYEKPQKGRYRQFTQLGTELIGAQGAMADAEVIYVACKGLDSLGLNDYRVVVGHIGVLDAYLESLGLENRLRNFLLANIETLRKDGTERIASRLNEIYPAFQFLQAEERPDQESQLPGEIPGGYGSEKLRDLLRGMDEEEAYALVADLLKGMNIQLDGNREPRDIIDRLLARLRRQDATPQLHQALEFMSELGQLSGDPSEVLNEAGKLLASYDVGQAPLHQLRTLVKTLSYYDLDQGRVHLDFGIGRGLRYYTGMIFEIHHGALGEERQLCGGGRYDDLITTLGGREDTPAAGFSYGLERIRLALDEAHLPGGLERSPDALVISVSSDESDYAVSVAEEIRQAGLSVEIDVRARSVKSNLRYASKRNIPFVIIIGSAEKSKSTVVMRNMAAREESSMPVIDAVSHIRRLS